MLAILFVAVLGSLVVHEAGHLLAAFALGGRRVRVKRIRWGAAVEAQFDEDSDRVAFLLAGPFASFAVGAILIAVGGWWGVAGVVSVVFGALTLAGSDGRQAWVAWTRAKSNNTP